MRAKAKVDHAFRERLLSFIGRVVTETLPEAPPIDDMLKTGEGVFVPFIDPTDSYFLDKMKVAVHNIVTSRNIHNRNHTPTCFKYGRKTCRFRFPHKKVAATCFHENTGLIEIQRDDEWLNGYNKWLAIMIRANHDC